MKFRTECNFGSKYFTDIAAAYRHFYRCVALRQGVELWAVDSDIQVLIDRVIFH